MHPVALHYSDIENSDIVLNCIYFAVVDSRTGPKFTFGSLLLPFHLDRIFREVFLHNRSIIGFILVFRRWVFTSVNDSVLLDVRKVVFQCGLTTISVNWAMQGESDIQPELT